MCKFRESDLAYSGKLCVSAQQYRRPLAPAEVRRTEASKNQPGGSSLVDSHNRFPVRRPRFGLHSLLQPLTHFTETSLYRGPEEWQGGDSGDLWEGFLFSLSNRL